MKTTFTLFIFQLVFSFINAQDCNLIFDDFESYTTCSDCDISSVTNGAWIPYDENSPATSIFDFGGDDGLVIDIPSLYSQQDDIYEPELIHVLNIDNPEVVNYNFDFYNECGVLALDFLAVPPTVDDSPFFQIEINYGWIYVGQDSIDICFASVNQLNSVLIELDFDSQKATLTCTEGPAITFDFQVDALQFYGVAYASNQCNYVDNVCVNNSFMLLDNDGDSFFSDVDCDDSDPLINPGMTEIPYNGVDDDCDPLTLEDDLDQDGFLIAEDCDDNNADINPEAEEIANNGIDEDCDGVDFTSSIYEISNAIINIYPNPTIELIKIDVSGQLEYQVILQDVTGRVLFQDRNASMINMDDLESGTYILRLEDQSSPASLTERIILLK